jgi:hypothetical protein
MQNSWTLITATTAIIDQISDHPSEFSERVFEQADQISLIGVS